MYLLDTSAILAHILRETGADRVDALMVEGRVYVATPSWLELRVRLRHEAAAQELIALLESGILVSVEISAETARLAYQLKSAASKRLPAIDALIAAAAAENGWTLVHRDQHFLGIPSGMLQQEMLS